MSSEVINSHYFNLQTKFLQEQAIASALEKTKQIATESNVPIKINVVARAICKESFKTFKKNVEKEFPSQTYHDLIILTLQAREALFFIDLKQRVLTIIGNPSSDVEN